MGFFSNIRRLFQDEVVTKDDINEYLSSMYLDSRPIDNPEKILLLYTCIGKRAEACTQVAFESHNAEGDLVEDDALVNLMRKPSNLQTKKEFIYQIVTDLSIFGSLKIQVVRHRRTVLAPEKVHLIALDQSKLTYPDFTYKNWVLDALPIKPVVYQEAGQSVNILPEAIILMYDDAPLKGTAYKGSSKAVAGKQLFSTSELRREADNVLTGKPGGMGILSQGASKDMGITVPLLDDEKKDLQKQFRRYGVSKSKFHAILSPTPKLWQPIAQPLKEWAFPEMNEWDYIMAANLFKIPKELLIKDATYENKQQALLDYYSGDPLSTMQSYADAMVRYFEWPNKITASFSHLPIMQAAEKKRVETAILKTTLAQSLKDLGHSEMADNVLNSIADGI